VLLDTHVVEPGHPALRREGLGLRAGPPVAGESGGTGTHSPFDCQQPPTRGEYSPGFSESGADVVPVVHGGHAPEHSRRRVWLPEVFRGALGPRNPSVFAGQCLSQPEHDRRRINACCPGATAGGFPYSGARAATDVEHVVASRYGSEISGQTGDDAAARDHGETRQQSGYSGEAWMVGVMVNSRHQPSLPAEPAQRREFFSTHVEFW
jgi:hypothetical protein